MITGVGIGLIPQPINRPQSVIPLASLPFLVSVRRAYPTYTGTILRVRRSSDGNELDIAALENGDLDESAIRSFIGSSDATMSAWYNQGSSTGVTVTQSTASLQPIIAVGGVLKKKNGRLCPAFDSTRWMQVSSVVQPWGANYSATFLAAGYATTDGSVLASIQNGTSWSSGNTKFYFTNGSVAGTRFGTVQYSGGWNSGRNGSNDGNMHLFSIVSPSGNNNSTVSTDGDLVSQQVSSEVNAGGTSFRIGWGSSDGAVLLTGGISELAMCSIAVDSATRLSITREQANYFGVSVP